MTPYIVTGGHVPAYYFIVLIALYLIHQVRYRHDTNHNLINDGKRLQKHIYHLRLSQVFTSSMFVASMAFFAKISDPAVGGTYMTLLNTLSNLGANWPATAALWFVDPLTYRQCSTDPSNDCSTISEREVGVCCFGL